MRKRTLAVLWSFGSTVCSGRLEVRSDRVHLLGRSRQLVVPLASIVDATILRGQGERLRGLPVLSLQLAGGGAVRVASFEGTAALHEVAAQLAPEESGGAPFRPVPARTGMTAQPR
jgi:hypothetical protein